MSRIDAGTLAGAAVALDGAALRLWCWMRSNANDQREFDRPHADTARALSVSEPTIGRGIRELKAAGLVTIARETARATVYRVLDPKRIDLDQTRLPFAGAPRPDAAHGPIIHDMSKMIDHSPKSDRSTVIVQNRMIDHSRSNTPHIGTRGHAGARLPNLPPLPSQSASSDIPPPPVLRGGGGGERSAKVSEWLGSIRDPKRRDECERADNDTIEAAIDLAAKPKGIADRVALAVRMVGDGTAAREAEARRAERARAEANREARKSAKLAEARAAIDEANREAEAESIRVAMIESASDSALVDALAAWVSDPQSSMLREARKMAAAIVHAQGPVTRGAIESACNSRGVRSFVADFLAARQRGPVVVPSSEGH